MVNHIAQTGMEVKRRKVKKLMGCLRIMTEKRKQYKRFLQKAKEQKWL